MLQISSLLRKSLAPGLTARIKPVFSS